MAHKRVQSGRTTHADRTARRYQAEADNREGGIRRQFGLEFRWIEIGVLASVHKCQRKRERPSVPLRLHQTMGENRNADGGGFQPPNSALSQAAFHEVNPAARGRLKLHRNRYQMKVFISWSGRLSQKVAMLLRDWLPTVLQQIEPWLSSEDIAPGARWVSDVASQLENVEIAIICLTAENAESAWLNFEIGAFSKSHNAARVCVYAVDIAVARHIVSWG